MPGVPATTMQRGASTDPRSRRLGRYLLAGEIASGGMATVYHGRLVGHAGFTREVAIKRMHDHFASDPEFVAMFLDEARLAARIQHPNVAATLDIVAEAGELTIVMEYVRGESLANLLAMARAADERVPVAVALSVIVGALAGLHAAHEARGDDGRPLDIVHRDVSPQNVLVGFDGLPRLVDFGIAKATLRSLEETQEGRLKGKLRYIAPEQIARDGERRVDRRADVYSAAVVLWEALAGRKLFPEDDPVALVGAIARGAVPPLSAHRDDVDSELERVVCRALERDPKKRYATAAAFAEALEEAAPPLASARTVGAWARALAGVSALDAEPQEQSLEGEQTPRRDRVAGTSDPPRNQAVRVLSAAVAGADVSATKTIVPERTDILVTEGTLVLSGSSVDPARRPRTTRAVALAAAVLAVGAIAMAAIVSSRRDSSANEASASASTEATADVARPEPANANANADANEARPAATEEAAEARRADAPVDRSHPDRPSPRGRSPARPSATAAPAPAAPPAPAATVYVPERP